MTQPNAQGIYPGAVSVAEARLDRLEAGLEALTLLVTELVADCFDRQPPPKDVADIENAICVGEQCYERRVRGSKYCVRCRDKHAEGLREIEEDKRAMEQPPAFEGSVDELQRHLDTPSLLSCGHVTSSLQRMVDDDGEHVWCSLCLTWQWKRVLSPKTSSTPSSDRHVPGDNASEDVPPGCSQTSQVVSASSWIQGESNLCPNCATPWKCNGPHITVDRDSYNPCAFCGQDGGGYLDNFVIEGENKARICYRCIQELASYYAAHPENLARAADESQPTEDELTGAIERAVKNAPEATMSSPDDVQRWIGSMPSRWPELGQRVIANLGDHGGVCAGVVEAIEGGLVLVQLERRGKVRLGAGEMIAMPENW